MTIKISFSPYSLKSNEILTQRFQFVYSPLNELFRSLHVLLNPRHHGTNIRWALTTIKKLDFNTISDLNYFSPFYEMGTPATLLSNFTFNVSSLDDELSSLKETMKHKENVSTLIKELNKLELERRNSFIPALAKGLEWQNFKLRDASNLLNDLKKCPNKVFDRFFNFVNHYRKVAFNDVWQEQDLFKRLTEEISYQSKISQEKGIIEMINCLQIDRIHWQDHQLIINKPFEREINLKDKDTIMLIPSYFTWPHLFIDTFKNGVVITYSFSHRQNIISTPTDLLISLKAISDPVRLQILKVLANTPSTTQSLAQILSLGNSTVSRHLQILKDAGLLKRIKNKKYVIYSLTNKVFELIPNIMNYLDTEN